MRMTRALAGGDVPSKENPPLDIKNVSGGGGDDNAYIEQLKSREKLLEENQIVLLLMLKLEHFLLRQLIN